MRTFDLVYGIDGQDQHVIAVDLPMWDVRRKAVEVLRSEQAACEGKGLTDLAATFGEVADDYRTAEVGTLVFGHVRRWQGADGSQRFIGVVERGTDYRDAGFKPAAISRATGLAHFTPTREVA